MITTERFNTLIQEQAASGYLTPIDSERDLSEVRGGGGADVKVKFEVSYDFKTGDWTRSGTLEISGNGGKLGLTLTEELKLKLAIEAEKKRKEQPKPPIGPSGTPAVPGTQDPTKKYLYLGI